MAARTQKITKKYQTSFTISPELSEYLDKFEKKFNLSSKSAALNTILMTFFKEEMEEEVILPIKNAILVPKELYASLNNLSAYSIESSIKKSELIPCTLYGDEYFAFPNTDLDIISIRLEKNFPLNERLAKIDKNLKQVLALHGIENDEIKEMFDSYKKTATYDSMLESTYLAFLADFKEKIMGRDKKDMFNPIEEPSNSIVIACGEKYNNIVGINYLIPLVDFMKKTYSSMF